MKKILIFILFLLFSSLTLAQDVVYDSIKGNRDNWFRIKGGSNEQITLGLMYENLGNLTKSKVLSAAGILDGMTVNVDYKDYTFDYDTLTYEFKTSDPINLLIYRYYYNDTTFRYFAGLRKAEMGLSTLEGQYLFITPLVVTDSEVRIYDGIGSTRSLFLTLKPNELNESSLTEYQLSSQVTVQGIKVSKVLRSSKTDDYITDIEEDFAEHVKLWPNPVSDILHVEMENPGEVVIRIFNIKPTMLYQGVVSSDLHEINVSSYASGTYLLIITNRLGIVLYTEKFIKI